MNERLAFVTTQLVQRLHEVIRACHVTEDELLQTVKFLTEVGHGDEFQLLFDVLGISVAVTEETHAADYDGMSTAHNVEGPLYREDAPLMTSPGKLCEDDENGEILFVHGQILSADGRQPLSHAILDVWQANEHGDYESQDENQADYNLRGRVQADVEGNYEFSTIVPGPYSIAKSGPVGRLLKAIDRHDWRPAHIHFRISCEGQKTLTTMLFVPNDPWIDSDAIGAVKESLVMKFERHDDPTEMKERNLSRPFSTCRYDFVLQPSVR